MIACRPQRIAPFEQDSRQQKQRMQTPRSIRFASSNVTNFLSPPARFYSPRFLTSASIGALQSGSMLSRLRTRATVSLTTE